MTNRERLQIANQLSRCFNLVESLVKVAPFVRNNRRHYVLAGYSVRTLDFIAGAISCLKHRRYASLPVQLRAAVDSFLFFVNTIIDENYDSLILVHTFKEKLRIARNAERIEALEDVVASDEFQEFRAYYQSKVDDLAEYHTEYNRKCKRIGSRFECAGMPALYWSMYSLLSGETHSDMMAVEHSILHGDIEDWTFRRCQSPTSDSLFFIHALLDLLVAIPRRLNSFLEMGVNDKVSEVEAIVSTLKEDFPISDDDVQVFVLA